MEMDPKYLEKRGAGSDLTAKLCSGRITRIHCTVARKRTVP